MKVMEKRKGRWGCPKCGCQAARRTVDRPAYVPVVFQDRRVTRFVGKVVMKAKVAWEGVPYPMGDVALHRGMERFLEKYTCPACEVVYKTPKWREG